MQRESLTAKSRSVVLTQGKGGDSGEGRIVVDLEGPESRAKCKSIGADRDGSIIRC